MKHLNEMGEIIMNNLDKIIKTNNAELIYKFALSAEGTNIIKEANIGKLEDAIIEAAIIEKRKAYYIIQFAKNVKGANISKLEDAIIESRSNYYIIEFAEKVKGANISKLEDAIIKINDADHIIEFAKDVKGANISKLEDAIIKKGPIHIYEFATNVKGANIQKLREALIRIKNISTAKILATFSTPIYFIGYM